MPQDYDYGQLIDDFELDVDVMPGETLTEYIERRRREFESKADGGSIGIEVFFGPKREDFRIGGFAQRKVPYDPRASAEDFAKALQSVSAGTTYQQQADAKRYARQRADEMLRSAMRSADPNKGPGLQGIYNTFFRGQNTGVGPSTFNRGGSGRMISYSSRDRDRILDAMANQMLNTTNYGTIRGGSSAPMRKSPLQLKIEENQRIYDEFIKNRPAPIGILTGPQGGAPTPPKPEYEDQALLSKLTMLTPEEAFGGETFETLSDLDQYNFAQAFTQFQPKLRDPTYVSPYGAPSGREIFARRYGIKDGGRVPMVSGGALKGLMSLFKGGDKAADLVKQEEIFRTGPITTKFLEDVDSKVIDKFVRTRDAKGPGSYGLYDNFDDMPAGLKAAEIIKRFVNRKTGEINYDAAEFFIGRKLKGNETIDELIDIAISKPIGTGKGPFKDFEEYVLNPAKKADGGRVGLFMGGDPLSGQALDIYNSMNAYGFSDAEIAEALKARGLYDAPIVQTPVINTAPNIINQGGGDGPPNDPPKDPFGGLGYSSANFGLGPNQDVMDYEADAAKIGRTFTGQLNKIGLGFFEAIKNIPTPFNLVRMGIQKAKEIARQKEIEKEAQLAAITRDIARENKRAGTGGYQSSFGKDTDFMEGSGKSKDMGSSKDGGLMGYGGKSGTPKGLATMFTRRR